MQTKQEIEQLLMAAGVEPNKKLGQHFLIDLNLMRHLLDCAGLGSDDIALEVGCGTGSLTEALAEQAGRVIAVEVDGALAQIAKGRLAGAGNVEIINADVLCSKHQLDAKVVEALQACPPDVRRTSRPEYPGRLVLVGNLPYSVAGPVMMNLIAGPIVADCMYVTVQKEVAQRMAAGPGDVSYGVLGILMAAAGEVKVLKTLKPSVFWPRPQVQSAMISFIRSSAKAGRIKNMELFRAVVNLFMQHRRKMLKGCVKFAPEPLAKVVNWADIFEKAGVDAHNRPEQVSAEQYLQIANLCSDVLCL